MGIPYQLSLFTTVREATAVWNLPHLTGTFNNYMGLVKGILIVDLTNKSGY